MTTLAFTLFLGLAVMSLLQSVFAVAFARLLSQAGRTTSASAYQPFVSVLLPLRGADPELEACVARLLQQDYPGYDVRAIIDSEEDPAWEVVTSVAARLNSDRLHISTIRHRRRTCSLQCSALSQAVEELDDRCEVVVIVDGDLAAHPTCLRELVAPLREESVAAAFGNRWFMPQDSSWGSWIRYLWNVAAVVPMYVFGIPWGGCFAIQRSALERSGLAESWTRSMVQDAPAKAMLGKLGLQLRFVPTLMMVNRDRCGLNFAHDFMKRQMMWTRLYHPNFWPLFIHAVVTTLALAATITLIFLGLVSSEYVTTAWASAALGAYLVVMLTLIYLIDQGVRRVMVQRGESPPRYRLAALLQLPVGILLTQIVYLSAVILATFRSKVTWRGVRYSWRGPYDVTVVSDEPFASQTIENDASNYSL